MELNIKPWTKEGIQEKEEATNIKDKSEYGSEEAEGEAETKKKVEEEKKEESKEENKQDSDKSYIYEAVGVVVHSGGAEGGHYYSYIKDRQKGKWYEFNDTQVRPFDLKNLAEETFGGESKGGNDFMGDAVYSRSKNAYFIIYQRKYPQPLPTVQLADEKHEYVKGIPKSVYQHIWDENMLFMKRMYFFDSEYLHFIREFLSLNNFERKLYITNSSLTKKLNVMKEAAEILEVTPESMRIHEPIKGIEIFDANKDELETEKNNTEVEGTAEFNPEKDLKDEKVGESAIENAKDSDLDHVLVDTRNIDKSKVEKAKDLLLSLNQPENKDELLKNLDAEIKKNPALYIIKFSTLFALKIKEHIKDSFSFISLLQQLNSMYEMHADGCMWLLKYLTYNKQMIINHLLKNNSEEERENFRALLITVISLVAKNEEKDFFQDSTNEYIVENIVDYDEDRDIFLAKKTPKAVLIRFMQVFFEEMLDDARDYFKNYEDYFQVLFYFARLGHMEAKYLVKAKGIFKLLDFIMNNSAPFHHNTTRKKMGSAISEPDFRTPIDLLSHLIRNCVTKGIKETETFSSVSLMPNTDAQIEIPFDEVKFITTRMCFTLELLSLQYNDSIMLIVLHMCWGDIENSRWFLEELTFSSNVQKGNISALMKRLMIIKGILQLRDNLQDWRMEKVCALEHPYNDPPSEQDTLDDNLLLLAKKYQTDYPLFSLEVIKVISDCCENPQMLLYLTKYKERIIWVRDFLDNLRGTLPDNYNAFRSASTLDISEGMATIEACIESLTQVFPDGSDGFRSQKEDKDQTFPEEENNQEAPEEGRREERGEPAPENPISEELDAKLRGIEPEGADDDFMNVARAPSSTKQSEDVPMSETSQK